MHAWPPTEQGLGTDQVALRVGVRVTFYDEVSEQFFGRTWASDMYDVPDAGRASTINVPLRTCAYYHTRVIDDTCYAVLEVVAEISALEGEGPSQTRTCALGWTTVPSFAPPADTSRDVRDCRPMTMLMYGGSPRVLLTLNKPIRDISFDRYALPGCRLEYRLHQHLPLAEALHLIRESVSHQMVAQETPIGQLATGHHPPCLCGRLSLKNVPGSPVSGWFLPSVSCHPTHSWPGRGSRCVTADNMVVGEASVIPGLTDAPLSAPELQPVADYFLDQLSVRFTPSVDEFEARMLQEILQVTARHSRARGHRRGRFIAKVLNLRDLAGLSGRTCWPPTRTLNSHRTRRWRLPTGPSVWPCTTACGR